MAIRPMRHGDEESIAIIERASPSPWPSSSVAVECDRPHGLQLVAADDNGTVKGWCCGVCMVPEAELLKIAVDPQMRRQGIAAALLARFENLCRESGCTTAFLEVRAANAAAIGLYAKFGFRKVGLRKNYYAAPPDDALILRKSLI